LSLKTRACGGGQSQNSLSQDGIWVGGISAAKSGRAEERS
jgi:hypothetical protein